VQNTVEVVAVPQKQATTPLAQAPLYTEAVEEEAVGR